MNPSIIYNVILPFKPSEPSTVYCLNGRVHSIEAYDGIANAPAAFPTDSDGGDVKVKSPDVQHVDGRGGLLLPSLCHSHVHLDKCYLLDRDEVQVKNGGFKEAFESTNEAKRNFTAEDLLARGRRLVRESVASGVTAMRCYAEVDGTVGMKCFNAAARIKEEAERARICDVQIAVFAQDLLFRKDDSFNRNLILKALQSKACSVLGTTPYVEEDDMLGKKNIEWAISTAIEHRLHLDFHLDFHLHRARAPLVHHVISTLKAQKWDQLNPGRTVQLGHCTRLTLFAGKELESLRRDVGGLPIHFAALPRSDAYMMAGRRAGDLMERLGSHVSGARGTIDVVSWIKNYSFGCSLAVNNVGNGFTPHGSVDPLGLLSDAVGILQRGGEEECRVLMECATWRAKAALGLLAGEGVHERRLEIQRGGKADFVVVGCGENRTVHSAVLSAGYDRITIKDGLKVASRRCDIEVNEWL